MEHQYAPVSRKDNSNRKRLHHYNIFPLICLLCHSLTVKALCEHVYVHWQLGEWQLLLSELLHELEPCNFEPATLKLQRHLFFVAHCGVQHAHHSRWNENIVILTKFSSLAALNVVISITCVVASDGNFIKLTKLRFSAAIYDPSKMVGTSDMVAHTGHNRVDSGQQRSSTGVLIDWLNNNTLL